MRQCLRNQVGLRSHPCPEVGVGVVLLREGVLGARLQVAEEVVSEQQLGHGSGSSGVGVEVASVLLVVRDRLLFPASGGALNQREVPLLLIGSQTGSSLLWRVVVL
jgi:hypothetical protein